MSTEVTVVTGGNRGIGAAIARRLVEAGHRVVVASRTGTGPDDCALTGAVSMDVSSAASIAEVDVPARSAAADTSSDRFMSLLSENGCQRGRK